MDRGFQEESRHENILYDRVLREKIIKEVRRNCRPLLSNELETMALGICMKIKKLFEISRRNCEGFNNPQNIIVPLFITISVRTLDSVLKISESQSRSLLCAVQSPKSLRIAARIYGVHSFYSETNKDY